MTPRALMLGAAIALAIALGPASWWDARTVDAHPRISTTLTWYADIAPLFERQCTSCHATGTVSMPLATYADVRPWVRAIREEVLERRMPPRRGAPGVDAGVDDHPLSPMERDLVVGWIDGGSPEGKPGAERTATFWCRMHPEVRAERAGPCPICGMALAPFLPDLTRRYGWTIAPTDDTRGRAGGRTLTLAVTSRDAMPRNGDGRGAEASAPTPVREFERVHDYPMHLFIVSEDFQRFAHVHPELDAEGRFSIAWPRLEHDGGLPSPRTRASSREAGRDEDRYWLYGDFLPVGGPPQMLQRAISVRLPSLRRGRADAAPGAATSPLRDRALTPGPASAPAASPALVAAEAGLAATLTVSPLIATTATASAAATRAAEGPRAGDVQRLAIALTEARGGKPIADLEPYLGAWGHLFLVHEGHEEALHAHPETTGTTPGGPTIAFDVLFPRAGTYYLWAQVQRRHRIVTLPFRIQVVPRA